MLRAVLSVVLSGLLLAATACGLVPSLPGGGGGSGGGTTAGTLWPDVPELPGSRSIPADLPPTVGLVLEGFVRSAQAGSPEGEITQDYDFVLYETAEPGTDLGAFYTRELMGAQGWRAQEGSCGDGSAELPFTGGLCLFDKPGSGGLDDHLVIVLLPAEGEAGRDQVAYLRFSATAQ
jgi:hypothetical protein